jgi:hypothetical protein
MTDSLRDAVSRALQSGARTKDIAQKRPADTSSVERQRRQKIDRRQQQIKVDKRL